MYIVIMHLNKNENIMKYEYQKNWIEFWKCISIHQQRLIKKKKKTNSH